MPLAHLWFALAYWSSSCATLVVAAAHAHYWMSSTESTTKSPRTTLSFRHCSAMCVIQLFEFVVWTVNLAMVAAFMASEPAVMEESLLFWTVALSSGASAALDAARNATHLSYFRTLRRILSKNVPDPKAVALSASKLWSGKRKLAFVRNSLKASGHIGVSSFRTARRAPAPVEDVEYDSLSLSTCSNVMPYSFSDSQASQVRPSFQRPEPVRVEVAGRLMLPSVRSRGGPSSAPATRSHSETKDLHFRFVDYHSAAAPTCPTPNGSFSFSGLEGGGGGGGGLGGLGRSAAGSTAGGVVVARGVYVHRNSSLGTFPHSKEGRFQQGHNVRRNEQGEDQVVGDKEKEQREERQREERHKDHLVLCNSVVMPCRQRSVPWCIFGWYILASVGSSLAWTFSCRGAILQEVASAGSSLFGRRSFARSTHVVAESHLVQTPCSRDSGVVLAMLSSTPQMCPYNTLALFFALVNVIFACLFLYEGFYALGVLQDLDRFVAWSTELHRSSLELAHYSESGRIRKHGNGNGNGNGNAGADGEKRSKSTAASFSAQPSRRLAVMQHRMGKYCKFFAAAAAFRIVRRVALVVVVVIYSNRSTVRVFDRVVSPVGPSYPPYENATVNLQCSNAVYYETAQLSGSSPEWCAKIGAGHRWHSTMLAMRNLCDAATGHHFLYLSRHVQYPAFCVRYRNTTTTTSTSTTTTSTTYHPYNHHHHQDDSDFLDGGHCEVAAWLRNNSQQINFEDAFFDTAGAGRVLLTVKDDDRQRLLLALQLFTLALFVMEQLLIVFSVQSFNHKVVLCNQRFERPSH